MYNDVPAAPSRRRTISLPRIVTYNEIIPDDVKYEETSHLLTVAPPSPTRPPSPLPPLQPMLSYIPLPEVYPSVLGPVFYKALLLDPAFQTLVYDFKWSPQTAYITGGTTNGLLGFQVTFPSVSQLSVEIRGISTATYICDIFQDGEHITIGDLLTHLHLFLHRTVDSERDNSLGLVLSPERIIDLLEGKTRFMMLLRDQDDPSGIHWYLDTAGWV